LFGVKLGRFMVAIALLLSAGFAIWWTREPLPQHKGKPLSRWFREFVANPTDPVPLAGLRAFGPAAAPFLLKQMKREENQFNDLTFSVGSRLALWTGSPPPLPRQWRRAKAAEALGIVSGNNDASIEALSLALGDPDALLRLEAVLALAKQGAAAGYALRNAIRDASPNRRLAAIKVIERSKMNLDVSLPLLLVAFRDPDPSIRAYATHATAKLGPAAVPALTFTLSSNRPASRECAWRALREIGSGARSSAPAVISVSSAGD